MMERGKVIYKGHLHIQLACGALALVRGTSRRTHRSCRTLRTNHRLAWVQRRTAKDFEKDLDCFVRSWCETRSRGRGTQGGLERPRWKGKSTPVIATVVKDTIGSICQETCACAWLRDHWCMGERACVGVSLPTCCLAGLQACRSADLRARGLADLHTCSDAS
jgi:hypothetical protein